MCYKPGVTLYQFARIVEIRTKIVSVSAFTIGTLYAVRVSGSVSWTRIALMSAAVLAVDMATTGFNSFFDYWSGVDRLDTNREADKVLVHQNVPPGLALIVSLTLAMIAIVLGLVLTVIVGPLVAVIGVVCMAVGFLYNGGPLPLSRTPFGELFAGGFLGWTLVSLSVYVHNGTIGITDLYLGLPSLFLVGSILTVNNTCDIDGDTIAGRRTLSILLGRRAGEFLVYLQGVIAFIGVAILGRVGVLPPTATVTVPIAFVLSLPIYIRMHRRGFSHTTKGASMQSISLVFVLFTVSIVVPLAITLL